MALTIMPQPDSTRQTAVQHAIQQYPWLSRLGSNIALTTGNGPYESESYLPEAQDNPLKGNFTVQLRSHRTKNNPALWPALIASESIDWLARRDPTYQRFASAFRRSMTRDQLANSRRHYHREVIHHGEKRPFEDFLQSADLQEYIRGYLFPDVAPGWTGPSGEGQYTTNQISLLRQLHDYLNHP